MDHGIDNETIALRDTTRTFVERLLRPHEREVEESSKLREDLRRSLRATAVELGLHAFNMPINVGGPGLSRLAQVVVREQLGQVGVALSDVVGRPPLSLLHCDEEQRDRYLLPAVRGELSWAFAITEPDAGSDVKSIRTRATATGDGYVLNGHKQFISHGASADFVIVYAKGADERISAFIVDRSTPGFRVGRIEQTMGWRGYELAELWFDDCAVGSHQLLGPVGEGLTIALDQINESRLGVAAHCLGIAQRALDTAVKHARERVQFGQAIGSFQGLSWMLADASVRVESARSLVYSVARAVDAGRARPTDISMGKLLATETAGLVVDACLQVMGGAGFMADGPMEMLYRDARAFRIGEGTSEVQRNQIARSVLGRS
ncbi:MAG TPA: acyl-CoA dehydrogenase family protein [Galbitalea sp.]|jgi:alkylation response protein AidB-like acyl-CoA dehydrogenase